MRRVADRLIFEVVAEGKGLKVVSKDVDSIARGVERGDTARKKAGRGQDAYNKREKALYQSNLSTSKGFSKMKQTIGSGSSGLVAAYATLAANVFAATAAFNTFREAAQVEQLIEGLNQVGIAAGRNLGFASEKLVEVAGHAISTEQAMRSMALGVSSGFSTEQMEGLTRVARGASLALGRNMTDAMDRLTRGAAKLEPEILDELGIMVRLDDATEAYAASMGKSVTQLSQFERRQAFLNAILEQGEQKFGALTESIDVNPYDKLASSLANLQKTIVSFFGKGFEPLVNALSSNVYALGAAVVGFGSTLAGSLLPGLTNMAQGMANAAASSADLAAEQGKNLDVSTKFPKAYRDAIGAAEDGIITNEQYAAGMSSLEKSSAGFQRNVDKQTQAQNTNQKSLNKSKLGLKENEIARQSLIRTYKAQRIASAQASMAFAVEAGATQGLRAGFKALSLAVKEYHLAQQIAAGGAGTMTGMLAALRTGLFAIAGAAKVAGAALMAALGWISLIASIGFMVYDVIKDKFFPDKEIDIKAAKIMDSLDSVAETATAFQKTLDTNDDNASNAVAGYKAIMGVMQDLKTNLLDLTRDFEAEGKKQQDVFEEAQTARLTKIEETGKRIAVLEAKGSSGRTRQQGKELSRLRTLQSEHYDALTNLQKEFTGNQTALDEDRKDKLGAVLSKTLEGVESSAGFGEFSVRQVEAITALQNDIAEGVVSSAAQIKERMNEIISPVADIVSAFEGARDAAGNYRKEVNKLNQKQVTPFDAAIDAAEGLQKQFLDLESGYKGLADAGDLDSLSPELKQQRKDLILALQKQMGTDKSIGEEALNTYIKSLKTARQTVIDTEAKVKRLEAAQKLVANVAKKANSAAALQQQFKLEEDIRKAKIDGIDAEIELQEKLRGNVTKARQDELEDEAKATGDRTKLEQFLKDRKKVHEDINKLFIQRGTLAQEGDLATARETFALEEARAKRMKEILAVDQKRLAAQKQILEAKESQFKAELQLAKATQNTLALTQGIELTPADELRASNKFFNRKLEVAQQEYNIALKTIEIEEKMMAAKVALMKAEMKQAMQTADPADVDTYKEIIADLDVLPTLMKDVFADQRTAAQATLDSAQTSLRLERKKLELANQRVMLGMSDGSDAAGGSGLSTNFGLKIVEQMDSALVQGEANWLNARSKKIMEDAKAAGSPISVEEAAKQAREAFEQEFGAGGEGFTPFQHLDLGSTIQMAMAPLKTMFDTLEALGTEEGPLFAALGRATQTVAGVVQGFQMARDFSVELQTLADEGDIDAGLSQKMQKFNGVATAVAAVAGAVSSLFDVMKAKTEMRIAGIDKEIAATKKLYGNTAEGEKRIAQLEAKKEALKKKAFKQQKAMMMAQVVMQTALGMISAGAAALQLGPFGIAIAPVLMGFIAALGAAQLAIIAGMSYQGGGSAGGSGKAPPATVTQGKRNNNVDVSSNNASGELAYMRGERGQGRSASTFTPAFTGYRNRATGGAAYVVGEQGPEVFVPEVPGRIVSNDDMREAGGTPVNATFNINAIDASNLEQTLTAQRGNIIGMIREAANSSGETFLENVDTLALGEDRNTY